jgi:methyl-accepting chemotaxis protein
MILFTAGILFFYYFEMLGLRKVATQQTGDAVMTGLQEKVQVGTESMAIALSEAIADANSRPEKERILREAVNDIRFEEDESGYYFIYRGTTAVTVPPNPQLRGQDLADKTDENGVYFVQELAAAARAGGGFVDYVFEKPEAGLQPKVSYAQMIPGTDYWIGTGVYADNVQHRQAAVAGLIAQQTQHSILKAAVVVLGFFGLVLAPLIYLIIRSILHPLQELRGVSEQIAKGDLQVDVPLNGRDEITDLLATTLAMRDQLAQVVADMQQVGDSISASSLQTASAAAQMSHGATQQASSTQALASFMKEIDSNIQNNADNAQETEKIADKAAEDAGRGGVAMQQTVEAMRTITQQITIIDEIARNTNLLALNAAVEAVRQEDQGKGFAVVASEVRKLAEHSQKAAGQIAEVSQDSVQVAETASKLLKSLIPDIQRTAKLINTISASSLEQRHGSQQVSEALLRLDDIVQQNASQAVEMASMAEHLSAQADQLRSTLGFFQVRESLGTSATS